MKSIESKVWRLSLSGLVLLLSFAFACQDKTAEAELQQLKAQAKV